MLNKGIHSFLKGLVTILSSCTHLSYRSKTVWLPFFSKIQKRICK